MGMRETMSQPRGASLSARRETGSRLPPSWPSPLRWPPRSTPRRPPPRCTSAAAGCSDTGSGTQAQPFCTISEAAAVATAGQTVLVSSGTYTENVTPAHSGTAGNPITFQAAPGATATITGATHAFTISAQSWITISGFTVTGTTSSGIYLWNASNITVSGNTVTASGQRVQGANAVGIYVGSTSNSAISRQHAWTTTAPRGST